MESGELFIKPRSGARGSATYLRGGGGGRLQLCFMKPLMPICLVMTGEDQGLDVDEIWVVGQYRRYVGLEMLIIPLLLAHGGAGSVDRFLLLRR